MTLRCHRVPAALLLWVLLLVLAHSLAFASYFGFAQEMFFMRQPSARAEAMGKGLVAVPGEPFASFYNPAGLADVVGVSISGGHASPLYLETGAKYIFLGGSIQAGTHGVAGFSSYLLDYDTTIYSPTGEPEPADIETSIQTLTLSTNRVPGIFLGVNLSRLHFDWPTYPSVKASAYWADVGALKKIALPGRGPVEQGLAFGGSLLNVTGSHQIRYDQARAAQPDKGQLPLGELHRVLADCELALLNCVTGAAEVLPQTGQRLAGSLPVVFPYPLTSEVQKAHLVALTGIAERQ